jgi:hypothetical protein
LPASSARSLLVVAPGFGRSPAVFEKWNNKGAREEGTFNTVRGGDQASYLDILLSDLALNNRQSSSGVGTFASAGGHLISTLES